jgi:hypothetical protein
VFVALLRLLVRVLAVRVAVILTRAVRVAMSCHCKSKGENNKQTITANNSKQQQQTKQTKQIIKPSINDAIPRHKIQPREKKIITNNKQQPQHSIIIPANTSVPKRLTAKPAAATPT